MLLFQPLKYTLWNEWRCVVRLLLLWVLVTTFAGCYSVKNSRGHCWRGLGCADPSVPGCSAPKNISAQNSGRRRCVLRPAIPCPAAHLVPGPEPAPPPRPRAQAPLSAQPCFTLGLPACPHPPGDPLSKPCGCADPWSPVLTHLTCGAQQSGAMPLFSSPSTQ